MENGKENGKLLNYRDCIGFYRTYIGIMEKKMETTIMGLYRFPWKRKMENC